jgi:hypothetical protein
VKQAYGNTHRLYVVAGTQRIYVGEILRSTGGGPPISSIRRVSTIASGVSSVESRSGQRGNRPDRILLRWSNQNAEIAGDHHAFMAGMSTVTAS